MPSQVAAPMGFFFPDMNGMVLTEQQQAVLKAARDLITMEVAGVEECSTRAGSNCGTSADDESSSTGAEPLPSIGSAGHPSKCQQCMYFFSKGGCVRGSECAFCHLVHQGSERRAKREAWKQQMRERKANARKLKSKNGNAEGHGTQPQMANGGSEMGLVSPSSAGYASTVASPTSHFMPPTAPASPATTGDGAVVRSMSSHVDTSDFAEAISVLSIQGNEVSVSLANPYLPDCPLVGISDGFSTLTGYKRGEILGRNCRFLNEDCKVKKSILYKLRHAILTGSEILVSLTNKKKDASFFTNLLHMSAVRVGDRIYIVGIQVNDRTNSGADISSMPDHRQELQAVLDRIFEMHVRNWAEKQLQNFCVNLPDNFSSLLCKADPEWYSSAKNTFVFQEEGLGCEGFEVYCKNTFLEVDAPDDRDRSGDLVRTNSSPNLQTVSFESLEASSAARMQHHQQHQETPETLKLTAEQISQLQAFRSFVDQEVTKFAHGWTASTANEEMLHYRSLISDPDVHPMSAFIPRDNPPLFAEKRGFCDRDVKSDVGTFAEAISLLSVQGNEVSVAIANPYLPDCPLIGISKGFTTLTEYEIGDILGRNCRFLNEDCKVQKSILHKLRQSILTGNEVVVTLANRRKSGSFFTNLLHMSALRVADRIYIVGIQMNDETASGAQISTMANHRQELQTIMDRIFELHLEKWAETQLQNFCINLPSSYVALLRKSDPEWYSNMKSTFVYQEEGLEGFDVYCKNTFLDVDGPDSRDRESDLTRSSSNPNLRTLEYLAGPSAVTMRPHQLQRQRQQNAQLTSEQHAQLRAFRSFIEKEVANHGESWLSSGVRLALSKHREESTLNGAYDRNVAPLAPAPVSAFHTVTKAKPDVFEEAISNLCLQGNAVSVSIANPYLPDCPLIGVSDGFTTLTGYDRNEIIGRNCRFLNEQCVVKKSILVKLRASILTGSEVVATLTNRKKNGEYFTNLLHMSAVRVGDRIYNVGIQVNDITQSGAEISTMPDHRRELQAVLDRVFDIHVEKWAEKQLVDFCINLPQSYSMMLLNSDPEWYSKIKSSFVSQEAGLSNEALTVFCKNTFLDIDAREDDAGLPRSSSNPDLSLGRQTVADQHPPQEVAAASPKAPRWSDDLPDW